MTKDNRQSGIEGLKVLAMLLIITHHMISMFTLKSEFIPSSDYMVNLSAATTDLQWFMLVNLNYGGVFGNGIFFVCSAWFLMDSMDINIFCYGYWDCQ